MTLGERLQTARLFVQNYKTYGIAALMGGLAVAQAFGYNIPEPVWVLLGAGGLAAHRASVARLAADVKAVVDAYQILKSTTETH